MKQAEHNNDNGSNGWVNYQAFHNIGSPSKRWVLVGAALIIIVPITTIAMFKGESIPQSSQLADYVGAAPFAGWCIAVGAFFYLYAWQKSKLRKKAFEQFAADNNWKVAYESSAELAPTALLGLGHDGEVKQSFRGKYKGLPIAGIIYEYQTGSGKSETTHQFICLGLELKQLFPLLVLDGRGNDYWGFSTLPNRIPDSRPLQLEGNFKKDYHLTILKGTELEVLQFMTPDFMSELLEAPPKIDIELGGNKLFVMAHSDTALDTFQEKILKELFKAVEIVLKHIGDIDDSWQASSAPEAVKSMTATALAPRQRLLRRSRYSLLGVIGGVVLILAGASLGYYIPFDYIIMGVVGLAAVSALYRAFRNRFRG